MFFDELNLSDNILDALYDMNFEECTPIQERCIPEILKGNDSFILIINPNMKTTSYDFIPIFINWMNNNDDYNYYYINGNNINSNDQTLLDQFEDENIKEYITGLNDLNIIKVKETFCLFFI